jgi:hypothetical protein
MFEVTAVVAAAPATTGGERQSRRRITLLSNRFDLASPAASTQATAATSWQPTAVTT